MPLLNPAPLRGRRTSGVVATLGGQCAVHTDRGDNAPTVTGTSGRFLREETVATTSTVPEGTAVRRAAEAVSAAPSAELTPGGVTATRNRSGAAGPSRHPDPPPSPAAAADADPVTRSRAAGNCG